MATTSRCITTGGTRMFCVRTLSLRCALSVLAFASLCVQAAPLPSSLPGDDRKAYEQLMISYQKQDFKNLVKQQKMFVRQFPQSSLRDNSIFLVAQSLLEQRRWNESLAPLDYILSKELGSERVPAALYARGFAYQQLGDLKKAKTQWLVLTKRFPGSRESQKAWIALRLLETQKQ